MTLKFVVVRVRSLAIILGLLALPVSADETGKRIAEQGTSQGAAPCSSCHGPDGAGNAPAGFPRLAGLNAVYLERQLRAYQDGTRRHPVMSVQAKGLTEEAITAVSRYYASLNAVSSGQAPVDGSSTRLGEQLAEHGDWVERGLPGCNQCHGPAGLGVGEAFPPLAGQPAKYLSDQIAAWKSGLRTGDPLGLMTHVANLLGEDEVKSIAAFYASLPVSDSGTSSQTVTASQAPEEEASSVAAHTGPLPHHGDAGAGRPAGSEGYFEPPTRDAYPDGPFGEMARKGEAIFVHTYNHPVSAKYVGNKQSCENCHLDAGRLANSSPMWASWVAYPAYRKKNKMVNTMIERIQGCFKYSMNAQGSEVGYPPAAESATIVSLVSYFYWLATGAPTGDQRMAGRGYPRLSEPPKGFDPERGERVYAEKCSLCHGADGEGQVARSEVVFPPLWGPDAFNWGAGMHKVDVAAAYIKWNMPLGLASPTHGKAYLSEQEAWDVAAFMNSHERPQDPRYSGSLEETVERFHNSKYDYYGKRRGSDGRLLGENAPH